MNFIGGAFQAPSGTAQSSNAGTSANTSINNAAAVAGAAA